MYTVPSKVPYKYGKTLWCY